MVQVSALVFTWCLILGISYADNVVSYGHGTYNRIRHNHGNWGNSGDYVFSLRHGPPACKAWCIVTFYNGLYLENRYDCCKFREKRGYCPSTTICSWPLPYFLTTVYQCFNDFQCPRNHKCCEDSCFLHRVCHPLIPEGQTETSSTDKATTERQANDGNEAVTIEAQTTTESPLQTTISTTEDSTSLTITSTTEGSVSVTSENVTELPTSESTTATTDLTTVTNSEETDSTVEDNLTSTTVMETESTTFHIDTSDSTNTPATDSMTNGTEVPVTENSTPTDIPTSTDSSSESTTESVTLTSDIHTTQDLTSMSTSWATSAFIDDEGSGSGDDYEVPSPRDERSALLWNENDDEDSYYIKL